MNSLEQLKKYTTVVIDTGDFNLISIYKAQDATTNPSLILQSVQKEEYRPVLENTVKRLKNVSVEYIADQVVVNFGKKILEIIPGRVSTEVDARLSFDMSATLKKGRHLIQMYEDQGVQRERILIKIASTWEGIQAAEILQREGINCNMTLLFSMHQAVACGKAKVKLISPFVGRIYDFYKKYRKISWQENCDNTQKDPGIELVQAIYNYYKKFGYLTEVMGASFRSTYQIKQLAGCDLLTISPDLLKQLQESEEKIERKLSPDLSNFLDIQPIEVDEPRFRFSINNDAMATEKLSQGIRQFSADANKLEELIRNLR